MNQLTFAEAEYIHKKRKTRREKFLEQMDALIPWQRLEKKIARHYPKAGNGRRPYPLPVMLRVHCLQLFYNLSDPAMEDALCEIESMRRFAGLRLSGALPDETTILNFRHLLEKHRLGRMIFKEVNKHLERNGLLLRQGAIVDASIISVPSPAKNQSGARDPEMRQTKKGNEWRFGMKMHIGVDADSGIIHSLETSAANDHDLNQAKHLLHGGESICYGDSGCQGVAGREALKDRDIEWAIAARPGKRRQMSRAEQLLERKKAGVRAKVEHPFRTIKCQFGYSKVRCRGLEKNNNRLQVLSAFSNLLLCKNMLPAWDKCARMLLTSAIRAGNNRIAG